MTTNTLCRKLVSDWNGSVKKFSTAVNETSATQRSALTLGKVRHSVKAAAWPEAPPSSHTRTAAAAARCYEIDEGPPGEGIRP
ncbi:hypothetical protein BaRGS_00015116 [Batillaria attramentaria]|uniref:Uncharacterized protein n=1 Tax=Batillaria attramentaria TaxID=370345 RepID=A0ABD0L295_9CAEN